MRALVSADISESQANALVNCTLKSSHGPACNLQALPLIGMQASNPTVDDVMARVLASDAWMAQRFQQVLQTMPAEILLMTRALTAVVILSDVRPSFYSSRTGAIYLDPAELWLTQAERADVDTNPDFRSDFGNKLDFAVLWRYVKDNEYVTLRISDGDRSIADIRYRAASLLYHELAHANDYFYPVKVTTVPRLIPIDRVAANGIIPSASLSAEFPLFSTVMLGLAQVSFRGITPTDLQRSYGVTDIAAEFQNDFASDYYNYTEREDLAMLFEELMMLYSFGVDRDVAVTTRPTVNRCSEYRVEWGQRNRILEAAVGRRAVNVARKILPESSALLAGFLATRREGPTLMTPGLDWCQNRFLDDVSGPRSLRDGRKQQQEVGRAERLIPYL